jgi:hypothetical protein
MKTTTTERDTIDNNNNNGAVIANEEAEFIMPPMLRVLDVRLMRGRTSADGWTVELVLPDLGIVSYGLLECHPGREVLAICDLVTPGEIAVWLPLAGQDQKWIGYGHALGRGDITGVYLVGLGTIEEPWLPVLPDRPLPADTWVYVRDATGRADLVWNEEACLMADTMRREDMGEPVEWELAEVRGVKSEK